MTIKLDGKGYIAHEIVDYVFHRKTMEEAMPDIRDMLNIALNHNNLDTHTRAEIIGKLCWRFGFEPPDYIIKELM